MSIASAIAIALSTAVVLSAPGHAQSQSQYTLVDSLDVAKVPAGFPVRFCLLTAGTTQYVAYYDAQRRMTVASRQLDSEVWQYKILPSNIRWDSHNYIAMSVDDDGHLHVSGNMHCVPLIYFRTQKPGDIATLRQFAMIGTNETRCTYPKFVRDAEDRLVFHYRDGGSGRGNEIYNVYDLKSRRWSRLLDQPLTDGRGKMNAYMAGPKRGPDGWFHMHWVWRDTPDCATNHHLSYARSRDLIHWESFFGDVIELPITLDKESLWVDPIPSGGGIINGCHRLFFDADNRPVITYHKSDANGNMQIYAARPKGAKEWTRHLLTDWRKPIAFSGGGSMGFIGIRISELSRPEPGILTMTYHHRDYGSGRLVLDEETLQPLKKSITAVPEYPAELYRVQSSFDGMGIRRAEDIGEPPDDSIRYILQWETLETNRDRPRQPPLPQPSVLRLYKLSANTPQVSVDLDTSEVPHLKAWGEEARALIVQWHPRIAERLATEGCTPAQAISLKLRKSDKGVGASSGTKITIQSNWIEKHPEDLGLVVHELVHVIQAYPSPKPWWITEGIADYLRWAIYEKKPQSWFPRPKEKQGYARSYRVTAGFFLWLESGAAPGIVKKLNTAMRNRAYSADLFHAATGQSLDELWDAYVGLN